MKQKGVGLQDIKTLFTLGTVGELNDGELLSLFITCRDEAGEMAFSALVERHGPMVLRVCRSILRDEHDAEDAFQATLPRSRRPGPLDPRPELRGELALWGRPARRGLCPRVGHPAARARVRAAGLAEAGLRPCTGRARPRAGAPRELARLPARYRLPIVLCYLEGMACEVAADRLRLPVGTVKSQAGSRARPAARRLIRRGLAPSAILLKSICSSDAARATMPSRVVLSTVRMATHFAGGGPLAGVVPVVVVLLTEGTLKAMNWSRLRSNRTGSPGHCRHHGVRGGRCSGRDQESGSATSGGSPETARRSAEAGVQAREVEAASPEQLLLRSRDVIEKLAPSFEKARLFSELATTQAELKYTRPHAKQAVGRWRPFWRLMRNNTVRCSHSRKPTSCAKPRKPSQRPVTSRQHSPRRRKSALRRRLLGPTENSSSKRLATTWRRAASLTRRSES